jgi:hypothetical protein
MDAKSRNDVINLNDAKTITKINVIPNSDVMIGRGNKAVKDP